jgi:predicted metal-dependent enzyme (double-stranded beta helix superfamily)
VIGVYTGREDNILWRRLPDDANGTVEAAGAKTLGETDTIAFGADVIHSVVNPVPRLTGAIHVYGGDFFGVSRSEWDPESLHEKPYDMEKVLRMFAR